LTLPGFPAVFPQLAEEQDMTGNAAPGQRLQGLAIRLTGAAVVIAAGG